ncbi:DUF885 family protein [Maribacter chungangensis]|uniref:DUF885 family protein n=1 Tax=Maribacter chungangensis TaxID=1069117 RepID=A0ABW3B7U7_9FLAO
MRFLVGILFLLICFPTPIRSQRLGEHYLKEWKTFYPSKALEAGIRTLVFNYEQRSDSAVAAWIDVNEKILGKLSKITADIDPIDARLLRVQAQSELDKWKTNKQHTHSLHLYAQLIDKAIAPMLNADYLLGQEKSALLCNRLQAISSLAKAAQTNLEQVSENELDKSLEALNDTYRYLQTDLETQLQSNGILINCTGFNMALSKALQNIKNLIEFSRTTLQQNPSESVTRLGTEEYNRRLALYTDSDLTSTKLAEMALAEISTVKSLMTDVSRKYLRKTYPDRTLPKSNLSIINLALADMEKDAPINATDYLEFWQELADSAVTFIKEKDIATLPKNNTLRIQTAPESAGAAARIGWVASAPPFDPNPMTTLNLPSIPESLPKQEQIDFWASFNKPFNRMIVIHELYPGHYMQLKISRESPHPVRLLFPYGIYIEGWATFTEKVLLDAGWESGNHLTLLAHLRKHLENANRAYTSVQVHCKGWNEQQVLQFSKETSLVAPQFAKSLWGRITNSPMQLTSYFLGGAQFTELLEHEKLRLGNQFSLKLFMDTVMKAGPIPIDEFYTIFKNTDPN